MFGSAECDELIDAIMGYGERRHAAADRATPVEKMMRAILGGGALATF